MKHIETRNKSRNNMKVISDIVVKDTIRWLAFDEDLWCVIKDNIVIFDGITYEVNPVYGTKYSIMIKVDKSMLNKSPEMVKSL